MQRNAKKKGRKNSLGVLASWRFDFHFFDPLLVIWLCLAIIPVHAQEETTPEDERTSIHYGEIVTGDLGNLAPRLTYALEALRCDFISIRLTPTSDTIDPVITVLDDNNAILFSRDDSGGNLGVTYDPIAIPESGIYTVVVGRFGYGLGSTYGSFELLIERIGNGSANGCGLRYGDSVYNNIDNATPELVYFFRAHAGDIINIGMQQRSGDLDTYLRLVNSDNRIIADNDDLPFSGGTDAAIQAFLIPADGTYYIVAGRYGLNAGNSSGNFMLTLEETADSGLGNSPIAPIPLRPGVATESALTEAQPIHYYRFEALQNDLITVSMEQRSGNLDPYLAIADANLRELAWNDDAVETRNALIEEWLIPADGTYFIIATRYQRESGASTGDYRLTLTHLGNAFDGVPADIRRITYSTTVTGRIDDITPQLRYAFRGVEGDGIRVSMNRGDGNLDPYINILSEDERILFSDDDSGGNKNALVTEYIIPYTGIFYLEATRYNGADNPNTAGSFTLVLAQHLGQ